MDHIAEEYAEINDILNKSQENKNTDIAEQKLSDNIFLNIDKNNHEEYQYLNLIKIILENGTWEEGRNGKTKSIFGSSMRFSLKDGRIPILTTKKTAWKTCLKELLWFIGGKTNNNILREQGVHIWDANAAPEFLQSRGLGHYSDGELGPIYGYQWRHFNKPYVCKKKQQMLENNKFKNLNAHNEEECIENEEKYVDQLQQIIDALKDPKQRTSRRLIMTAWNPSQLKDMCLPACHVLCQFNVHDGNKLSCMMVQRSADFFLGSCFNIASYSFLTHLLAKHCGLEAHDFVYFMGNIHLYENAIDVAKLQITRVPFEFPTLSIKQVRENINDYQVEDFEIHNYKHHEAIKVPMIA